jgi:4-aminobutyrate aminotransferase-like enzyme
MTAPYEYLIDQAKEAYAQDRCSIEEFEQFVDDVLHVRFPIQVDAGWKAYLTDQQGRPLFDVTTILNAT